jgi:MFS family permease
MPRGPEGRGRAVGGLCITELVSWGVLYYTVPATLPSLVEQTGWSATQIMTGFTAGLLVNAAATVPVGRVVDRHGPRWVMTAGSALGAVALVAVAASTEPRWFAGAWMLAGLAQACLLYPPAFTALTRWYGPRRVRPLTILVLTAGLASTVFAPITAELTAELGWRNAYLVLAALLLVVTAPIHVVTLNLPWPAARVTDRPGDVGHIRQVSSTRAFRLLALAFAVTGLGLYAATTNLVPLLVDRGIDPTTAATVFGLCGAGQLLGRVGFPALTRRTQPHIRDVAILTAASVSVVVLALSPRALLPAIATAVLAGAARGAFTLVQASAVADRWGTRDFGTINALATTPAAIAIALAPATGAALAEWAGGYTLAWLLLGGLVAIGALLVTGTAPPGPPTPEPGGAPSEPGGAADST